MSELEFPGSIGYAPADGKPWTPKSETESRARFDAFFGKPEQQDGPLQACGSWNFDYFESRAETDEAHKRVFHCRRAFDEYVKSSEQKEGFELGYDFAYVAALAPNKSGDGNPITDDRILLWRFKSPDPQVIAENGGTHDGLEVSSAQYFDQMISWCETQEISNLMELNFLFTQLRADHEDILNFCKNFKVFRQQFWGSLNNNEPNQSSE